MTENTSNTIIVVVLLLSLTTCEVVSEWVTSEGWRQRYEEVRNLMELKDMECRNG